MDGDPVFEAVGKVAPLVHGNAPARRKCEPMAQSAKGSGLAKEALRDYQKRYAVERKPSCIGLIIYYPLIFNESFLQCESGAALFFMRRAISHCKKDAIHFFG